MAELSAGGVTIEHTRKGVVEFWEEFFQYFAA